MISLSQRMKVLYVITSTTVGGAERTVLRLAKGLDRTKVEVGGVISLKPLGAVADELRASGIPVESVEMGPVPTPGNLAALASAIKARKPDIVHAVLYRAVEMCRWLRKRGDLAPWLVGSHRVNLRTRPLPLRLIDRSLRAHDDHIVAECDASREYLISVQGYDPQRVETIHNGTDAAAWFFSEKDRREKRGALDVAPDEFLIGAAGRLDRQKGFEFLIRAAGRLKREGIKARVVVFGEGPLRTRLERRIRAEGLEREVHLAGAQPDLRPWYCALDAFALPSRWEGFPNVLLEAMAMGLPCAAAAVDGVPELIEDGKTGLLAVPEDAAALTAALARFARDKAMREATGFAAKRRVREAFTLDRMMNRYAQMYARVARG